MDSGSNVANRVTILNLKAKSIETQSMFLSLSQYWVASNFIFILLVEVLSGLGIISSMMLSLLVALIFIIGIFLFLKSKHVPLLTTSRIGNQFIKFWVLVIFLCSLITGIFVAPNNWDSMTYHLPRVIHWLRNGSVDHVASLVERQNYISPFGDYQSMGMISFGSDRFAFFPSFISGVFIVVIFFKLAKFLEIPQHFSLLGVLIILSPNFVSQLNTTQVDIRATCFAALGTYLLVQNRNFSICLGLIAFGLAFGTKFLGLLPFLSLLMLPKFRASILSNLSRSPFSSFLGIFGALLVNIPWLLRNMNTYGNLTGEAGHIFALGLNFSSRIIDGFRYFATNIMYYPADAYNSYVKEATKSFLWFLFPSYTKTTPFGLSVDTVAPIATEDDVSSAFLVLFLVFTVLYLCWKKSFFKVLVVTSPFLFTILVFAWQPWINRLLLSNYIVSVLISLYFFRNLNSNVISKVSQILAICVLVTSSIYVFDNQRRGLLETISAPSSRISDYFYYRKSLEADYVSISQLLETRKVEAVHLTGIEDSWEYPLLVLNPNIDFQARFQRDLNTSVCLDACALKPLEGWTIILQTPTGLTVQERNTAK